MEVIKTKGATPWRSIAPASVVIDDGDILAPLRRLVSRYESKASKVRAKAFGDNRSKILVTSDYYADAAQCIRTRLLDEAGWHNAV
jgi:hypothetical protein